MQRIRPGNLVLVDVRMSRRTRSLRRRWGQKEAEGVAAAALADEAEAVVGNVAAGAEGASGVPRFRPLGDSAAFP